MTGTRQTRRSFLKLSAATTLGFVGLGCACDPTLRGRNPGPYGDLVTDPEGIIDLPRGFSYDVVARAGDRMTDGLFMPEKQDGMAAFAGSDGIILICNHENDVGQESLSAFGDRGELNDRVNRELVYDVSDNGLCPGGTTTILYDTSQRRTLSMHLSLAGTLRNCAGGLTPWNSWITCEETVRKAVNPASAIAATPLRFPPPHRAGSHLQCRSWRWDDFTTKLSPLTSAPASSTRPKTEETGFFIATSRV